MSNRPDSGLLIRRLVAGCHLIPMSQDNVFSWVRMLHFRDDSVDALGSTQ